MFDDIEIRNGFLFKVSRSSSTGKKNTSCLGKAIFIDAIEESIETGQVRWKLHFNYLGNTKYVSVERKEICDNKALVSALASKGAAITAKNAEYYIDSLLEQECNLMQSQKIFHNVGWIYLPVGDQRFPHYRSIKLSGTLDAKYAGDYQLNPMGTLAGWCDLVKNEVLGRVQLETVLLVALAAPVVGLISSQTTGENPIVHLNFDSGKGKTTVLYLAASVSGEPFDGKKRQYDRGEPHESISIYQSWGATEKATVTSCAGNRGVVVVLNELGKYAGRDLTSVIFNLSEGSDIKRLKSNLQNSVTEGYDTTFLSCGEMSLLKKCKSKFNGIRVRVMEIEEAMTENAEHSRRIKDGARKNNGYAAPVLAKYIIDNGGADMVQQLYNDTLKDLIDNAPQDIDERFVEKFPAFFVTTAKLAKEALGLTFNIEAVIEFCYKCWRNAKQSNGAVDKSYEDIIGECGINVASFYDKRLQNIPHQLWGAVSYPNTIQGNKKLLVEYAIKRQKLEELLEKHGHQNLKTCIKTWKAAGVMNCEKGRNTRSRIINEAGMKEDLYVLQVWADNTVSPTRSSLLAKADESEGREHDSIATCDVDCA